MAPDHHIFSVSHVILKCDQGCKTTVLRLGQEDVRVSIAAMDPELF